MRYYYKIYINNYKTYEGPKIEPTIEEAIKYISKCEGESYIIIMHDREFNCDIPYDQGMIRNIGDKYEYLCKKQNIRRKI